MQVIKVLFLAFLVLFGCPTSVSALTTAERYKYAQDDITFVDTCTDLPASLTTLALTTSSATGTADLAAEQVQFIETYHDIAVTLSTNYGIPWETVVAQGILESASGSSNFAVNRNNFFGIGAYDSNPDNAFSYATPMEGWEGYYKNIVNTSVYRENGVFSTNSPYGNAVTDPIAYAQAIKAAGYATDPDYVAKLTSLINGINNLAKTRNWPSSEQVAQKTPAWFSNAEKYRQGASVSPSSSSASTTPGSTPFPNGCPSSTRASVGVSSAGVTTTTFNGQTIAFPIALATKENISGSGFLSDLPCNHSIGCHYGPGVPSGNGAAAFDICFKDASKCEGTTPGSYGNTDAATVVSITAGTITKVYYERNGATCNHVIIRNSLDNTSIAYMHMLYEPDIKEGVDVSAGDVIGHVSSLSPCHDNSTPHVHIDKSADPSVTLGPTADIRDPKITEIINAAYAALPQNDAELASREQSAISSSSLKSGGMTLDEAKKFMLSYVTEASRQLRGDYFFENALVKDSSCPNGTLNNCSAFTQWFLNRYTSLGPSGANIWQGSEAVSNYVSSGQLTYGGKVPRPYAVISMGPFTGTADGWPNHTAIVLGIDQANDQIIVGEAGCSASFIPGANVYSLSEYTNSPSPYGPTYAYTDSVIKGLK